MIILLHNQQDILVMIPMDTYGSKLMFRGSMLKSILNVKGVINDG